LVSVDGMRPDALEIARTPVIDSLRAEGAYTGAAQSIMPSVTLPCHMSMLRGVEPGRHGITTNTFQPLVRPVPSLIDVAKSQGLTTGFFLNWEPLRDLSDPLSLDVLLSYADHYSVDGDRKLAAAVVHHFGSYDLDFTMVYLGWTDLAGHESGWMSDEQIKAVEGADSCIGMMLQALSSRNSRETVTLVTADHGGHERAHGTDMPEDMTIPWLLHGPGVRRGHTISAPVRIYDTCTTLAHILGLPASREWDGRVIEESLE
jgi:predicted AlkP superfamily pyrophosphatase or phosphodiesterase